MGNINRKTIIISIVSILTIMIGLVVFIYYNSSMMASKALPVQDIEQVNINKAVIGEYISNNHDYWNDELCWGRSESFSFVDYQKYYSEYIEDLNKIINAVNDKDLKVDFIHAHDLLKNAHETKDIDFLIDVHRVFHDLDVKYNRYSTSGYFGITQYGEKHDE